MTALITGAGDMRHGLFHRSKMKISLALQYLSPVKLMEAILMHMFDLHFLASEKFRT